MTSLFRRWPGGPIVTASFLMLAALMLGHMLVISLVGLQRSQVLGQDLRYVAPDQIAAMIELFDSEPVERHPLLLRALNTLDTRVTLADSMPEDVGVLSRNLGPNLRSTIARYLPDHARSQIDGLHVWTTLTEPEAPGDGLGATPVGYLVAMPLANHPKVLVVEQADTIAGRLAWIWAGGALLLCGTIAIGLLASLIRRVLAPLSQIATAAERLGQDIHAPPMAVTGTQELRQVILALNAMQSRIQALIAERSQQIAAISHDMRSVLMRMRLRMEGLADESRRALLARDIDRLSGILNQNIAFAAMDAVQEPKTMVDLSALLTDIVEDAPEPIRLVMPDEPVACPIRPEALRRALENLVGNALAYGRSAALTLERSPTEILIRIEDEGPGLTAEEATRILKPFERGKAGRDRPGSGLGLPIAESIIRSHGGRLSLQNRPEGGLSVRIRLPLGG